MSLGARIFAATYDQMSAGMEKAGLGARRRKLLGDAAGHVLEIGAGTGANLQYYGDDVESLTISEPEDAMARRLERRLRERHGPVELVRAAAEDLPFDDGQFDTVVATLVLCTVDDQAGALAELRRVLKPGGRLLFLEHVRAEGARLAAWQDRLNGFNRIMGHGCNCNRDTVAGIRRAGFEITTLESDALKRVPPIVSPLAVGVAERNGAARR